MSRRLLVGLALLAVTACEDPAGSSSLASRESAPVATTTATPKRAAPTTAAPKTQAARVTPRPSPTKTRAVATRAPSPTPAPVRTTTAKPVAASTCGAPANPWGYNFCGRGSAIYDPPVTFCNVFDCIASFWESTNGYVMQCEDLTFSHSGGRSGSCSHHGGNYRALSG